MSLEGVSFPPCPSPSRACSRPAALSLIPAGPRLSAVLLGAVSPGACHPPAQAPPRDHWGGWEEGTALFG